VTTPPPQCICEAFGAAGEPVLLAGGQGRTWLVGDRVLKPVDNRAEHDWVSDVFAGWRHHDRVRVPAPVRSRRGAWVHDGWAAHRHLAGRDARTQQDAALIRATSEQFHHAICHLAPPQFLAERDDPWSYGDTVAWAGAEPVGGAPTLAQIARLRAGFEPVAASSQVIHGDIGGNVLVTDDGTPGVIDWPPYFRPVGFALAVAAGDAVRWEGVPLSFIDAWADIDDWYQLVARALVYRLATAGVGQQSGHGALTSDDHARASEPAVAGVLERIAATT